MENRLWMDVFIGNIIDNWSIFQHAMFDYRRVQYVCFCSCPKPTQNVPLTLSLQMINTKWLADTAPSWLRLRWLTFVCVPNLSLAWTKAKKSNQYDQYPYFKTVYIHTYTAFVSGYYTHRDTAPVACFCSFLLSKPPTILALPLLWNSTSGIASLTRDPWFPGVAGYTSI